MCKGHVDEEITCSKSYGGKDKTEDCTGDSGVADILCPVPPIVTNWSSWSACSKDCEGGKQSIERTCTKGLFHPIETENSCPTKDGVIYEKKSKTCNIQLCPVGCEWGEWGQWGTCSQSCQ